MYFKYCNVKYVGQIYHSIIKMKPPFPPFLIVWINRLCFSSLSMDKRPLEALVFSTILDDNHYKVIAFLCNDADTFEDGQYYTLVRGDITSRTTEFDWWKIDGPEVTHFTQNALREKHLFGKICCVLLQKIETPNPFDI